MSACPQRPAGARSVETEIAIAASPDLIWSILVAFADYGDWNRYIPSVTGSADPGANLVVRTHDTASGHEMDHAVRVEQVEPYVLHWVGEAEPTGLLRGDHFFKLRPNGAGETLFLQHEHFTGSLADTIAAQFGEALRINFETFNLCLKAHAEAAASGRPAG